MVLHTTKFSETSVIVKIYTEKLGLVSYIVKGVRSSKSKGKASQLQPLALLDMAVTHQENKQLQYIKEYKRAYTYQTIPFDTVKSTMALFLLEVITKAIREHEQNEELFDFLFDIFQTLDRTEKVDPNFHLIFMLRFSGLLGFMPQGNYSQENQFFKLADGSFTAVNEAVDYLSAAESKLLFDLLNANLFSNRSARISRTERKKLLVNLIRYYQFHLENFSLKSPEILEEILG